MATSFDLGGLLGSAFGADEYGDLLTPAQQSAIQQRALLSAASALLQAGAPSTTRTSLGQALGAALTAGQTGAEKAQQSALTGMLTRQKLEEARRAKDLQDRIGRLLTPTAAAAPSATVTPEMALAAPVTEEMPAGPTVARAAMIGQAAPAAPAMSQLEMRAQQYRQIADVYAAAGKGEDAKRYMDIAEQLAPSRQEVVGDIVKGTGGRAFQRTKTGGFIEVPPEMVPAAKPVGPRDVVTDPKTGNEILVQGYDDGSIRTVEGFGPRREVVLQNVDGKIVAIDKSTVTPGQTFGTGRDLRLVDLGGRSVVVDMNAIPPGTSFAKSLAPQVVGGAETGYYVLGGAGGAAAPRALAAGAPAAAPAAAPSAPAARTPAAGAAATAPAGAQPAAAQPTGPQPIIPGTGQKPPEAFMKAARQLNDLKGSIIDYKQTLETTNWLLPTNIPIPFTEGGIALPTGSDSAAVSSRYNALLMGVKNLYELGALTGPDMSVIERQITNPASWAGLLTSRGAMNEQVRVLEDMLDRAEKNLERSYKQKIPEAAAVAPRVPPDGTRSVDINRRPIIVRNRQWVYQ